MDPESSGTGWQLVAQSDEVASLLATLVELEPDRQYTRSDLADAAAVPLKTLYLVDTLEELVELGVLTRVDSGNGDSEPRYVLNGDSQVLTAARQFDDTVARNLAADGAE